MVQLTDSAKDYLKSIANNDIVTLGVQGGGCSGFTYVWDFKSKWPDVIDYIKELGGSYLKVINPNAVAQCGCGTSFGV